jgi:hypothetical protein
MCGGRVNSMKEDDYINFGQGEVEEVKQVP